MRGLSRLSVGLVACVLAGCVTVQESPLEIQARALPQCCRDNVYPIFVDSPFDPIHLGGIPRLANYATENGFQNTELFSFYTDGKAEELAERIRQIKRNNPHARVMLVGFSTGCVMIFNAMKDLCDEGIGVESICYLDSFTLCRFCKGPHPENVGCISLLYRKGKEPPQGYPRAVLHAINTTDHFDVPANAQTVHVILSHLCMHGEMY